MAAHRLISDLFTPIPAYYWREFLGTGLAAWTIFVLALSSDSLVFGVVFLGLAVPIWYRAATMVHELTHQRRRDLPHFHAAWNLIIGVAWLLPSVMYENVHYGHHNSATYGTAEDPEYLPLAGNRLRVITYLTFAFLVFPLLLLRFLVLAPLSYGIAPLRRFLVRSGSSYVINLDFVREMSPDEQRMLARWECVIFVAWWTPFVLSMLGELRWRWLIYWYALYTGVLLLNRLRMLAAHHFAMEGQPGDHLRQFADSIDTPAGWWAELWAPLGLRYHALHHLFPAIPFHNMRKAYGRLVENLPASSFYHQAQGGSLLSSVNRFFRMGNAR
jgi:fatty acid desaturase